MRELAAKELRKNIEANINHPSVMLWSIANELSSKPGPVQGAYIRRAVEIAHDIDPTRPTAIAFAGYPTAGCQTEYAPLGVIGLNDYFGWYPGPGGKLFDRAKLSAYLDEMRRCYPRQAIMVSEFGAEANRDGPVEEKGTYAFQQDFVNYHLGVFASKPWLSGALYWALNEFRVKPDWEGGNPRPSSAAAPEGPARLRHVGAQAGVGGRAALVLADPAVHPARESRRAARARAGTRRAERACGAAPGGYRWTRRRAGSGAGSATRRRSRRGRRSASRSWPRRRTGAGSASGSGTPPEGETLGGRSEIRSLPPPPPSSSSGPCRPSNVSERRNSTNKSTPSTRATKCSPPKMSISSSSGDMD